MLSVFEPGHPFPWLGDLSYLGPAQEHPSFNASAKETAEDNPFPILPEIKHSYNTQCNAVWIKSSGLQVRYSCKFKACNLVILQNYHQKLSNVLCESFIFLFFVVMTQFCCCATNALIILQHVMDGYCVVGAVINFCTVQHKQNF